MNLHSAIAWNVKELFAWSKSAKQSFSSAQMPEGPSV